MSSMSWSIFLHLFFLFFKGWRNSGTVSLLVWRGSAVVGMSQGVESCTGISRNTSSTEGFNVYQWVQVANSFICDYSFYVGVLFLSSSQISLIVGVFCCLEAKKKKIPRSKCQKAVRQCCRAWAVLDFPARTSLQSPDHQVNNKEWSLLSKLSKPSCAQTKGSVAYSLHSVPFKWHVAEEKQVRAVQGKTSSCEYRISKCVFPRKLEQDLLGTGICFFWPSRKTAAAGGEFY